MMQISGKLLEIVIPTKKIVNEDNEYSYLAFFEMRKSFQDINHHQDEYENKDGHYVLLDKVLKRALFDLNDEDRRVRADAYIWLTNRANISPFSVIWVCDHLNIEPIKVFRTVVSYVFANKIKI